MNKKEQLLKKNSRQLRSLVVDATAVRRNTEILKQAEDLGGHFITYGMWKENQSILTIRPRLNISSLCFLLFVITHHSSFFSVKSIIILLSGQRAVEIPCGEGYAKQGR